MFECGDRKLAVRVLRYRDPEGRPSDTEQTVAPLEKADGDEK